MSRSSTQPEPILRDEGAAIIGPTNPVPEAERTSRLAPPETDHGTLPSLKWSFADCHNRVPKEVRAKNFAVPESTSANIPETELYISQSEAPGPLAADRVAGAGPLPLTYSHPLIQRADRHKEQRRRIVDSSNFPAARMMASGLVEVEPGGMREQHWHPNSNELQYYIEGKARMRVYASGSDAQTLDDQGADVGYEPESMPHYVENTGANRLRYLELCQSDHFADVSLAQWLAFTPYKLVKAHLNHDKSVLSSVSAQKMPAVEGSGR